MQKNQVKSFTYLLAFFSLVLFTYSCDNTTEPIEEIDTTLAAISIDWADSSSIVCFGTSITAGGNNSDSTYPALLAKELKIKVYNHGLWGNLASNGIEQFNTDLINKNPALILLEFGANEFLKNFSLTTAKTNIDSLIRTIKSKNIKIVFLNFIHPDMLNQTSSNNPLAEKSDLALEYYAMINEVSESNNIPVLEYIYNGIWGRSDLMLSDGLHPNNKGNVQLKENVFNALYKTFETNNMLK